MKVVFFILPIIILIVIFVILSLKIKILMLLSTKSKSIYYSMNHKVFSILEGKILVLSDGSISVINKKNIIIDKHVPSDYSKILATNIIKILRPTKLNVYISTGNVDNAYKTAIIAGLSKVFGGIISALLKSKDVEVFYDQETDTSNNEFSVAVDLNLKISIIKLIFILIKSKKEYKKIKENNNEN